MENECHKIDEIFEYLLNRDDVIAVRPQTPIGNIFIIFFKYGILFNLERYIYMIITKFVVFFVLSKIIYFSVL